MPLTDTKWDALLAAVVEHVAWLHGHERPAWVDEPERFIETTWVLSPIRSARMESLMYAPAAFLRHGAIPDPRDLDGRGGERYAWTLDRERVVKLFDELSVIDFAVPRRHDGPHGRPRTVDDFGTLVTLANTTPAGPVRCR